MLGGMARLFHCPYPNRSVELTDEREAHIRLEHSELLPGRVDAIAETLVDRDAVRRSSRFINSRLFTRWYDDLAGGKHAVVVVVSNAQRDWIVTAYVARRLRGEVEWERS